MTYRIDLLPETLRSEVATASERRLRQIAVASAIFAIGQSGLQDGELDRMIGQLRSGEVEPETVRRARKRAAILDDLYPAMPDESDDDRRDPAKDTAFRRARAAAAVVAAADRAADASGEALYEAFHAIADSDLAELTAVVKASDDESSYGESYAAASEEWSAGSDQEFWETTTGDGIEP